MRFVAVDTETCLIAPGLAAPPLVCVSYYDDDGKSEVLDRKDGLGYVWSVLTEDDVSIVGHNIAYDMAVIAAADRTLLPLIFRKYEKGLVRDTGIRQKLIDLASGTMKFGNEIDPATGEQITIKRHYGLADLVRRYTGKILAKGEDTWRLRYGSLREISIGQWPDDARKYALDDAEMTMVVFLHQSLKECPSGDLVVNELEQARAAWSFKLMSVWGMRTDPASVTKLQADLEASAKETMKDLVVAGLIREDGSKNTKAVQAAVVKAYGNRSHTLPRTAKTQQIQITAAVLNESDDPTLSKLVDYQETEKLLTSFVPVIRQGTVVPINPSYNELVESGRCSSFKPNIQQLPRKGGVRECFIPRPGYVYIDADYSLLEMATLAQACLDVLGHSSIAKTLKDGKDPHLMVAAQLLGHPYDIAAELLKSGDKKMKEYRQYAKVANYGYGGGMGFQTFVTYAANQGVKVTQEQAKALREAWFETFPEMNDYFRWINSQLGPAGEAPLKQLRSDRVRYVHMYTVACNTFFQGLAADGAKEACFRVAKECYSVKDSPLYGTRPVAFIHDEILCESPEELAIDAAERLAVVMVEGMKMYVPDVPIKAEPVVMRRWWKSASSVRDENGKLQIWDDVQTKEAA